MTGLRYVLIALLVSPGCESTPGKPHAADGGASDAGWSFDYDLCDGSDQIRFAFLTRRSEGNPFDQPYGVPHMFVDGRCDFIVTPFDQPSGSLLQGHFTQHLLEIIDLRLGLADLPAGAFPDPTVCPDPGSLVLATKEFYGECSCGCKDSAPPELERTVLEFIDVVDDLARKAGEPGEAVEVTATKLEGSEPHAPAKPWPFAWPVDDVINEALSDADVQPKSRVLTGADAEKARALRSQAHAWTTDQRVLLESDMTIYRLFVRDRIESSFAAKISRFLSDAKQR